VIYFVRLAPVPTESSEMSALYGRLKGERQEVARSAHHTITATLETWEGQIRVELGRSGSFLVWVGDKDASGTLVAAGNVNAASREFMSMPAVDRGEFWEENHA
jgi:hypothetical protein